MISGEEEAKLLIIIISEEGKVWLGGGARRVGVKGSAREEEGGDFFAVSNDPQCVWCARWCRRRRLRLSDRYFTSQDIIAVEEGHI